MIINSLPMSVSLFSLTLMSFVFVLLSSKLAAVLRKLHNANDMLHSSAYESGQPSSPNVAETSMTQSSPTASFALSDEKREGVEQLSDMQRDAEKIGVDSESAAHESPTSKVK